MIGMGVVLSIWAEVGEHSIVAEGSVVRMKQKVPSGMVIAGNPARIIREVSSEDDNLWNYGKQVYTDVARKYLDIGMHRIDQV